MAGARTRKLIDNVTTVITTSITIHPQRARDEAGIFFIDYQPNGGTPNLNIQLRGRPDASANWFNIHRFLEGDVTGEGTAAAVVALFPQMEMRVTVLGGTAPVLNAWITE